MIEPEDFEGYKRYRSRFRLVFRIFLNKRHSHFQTIKGPNIPQE